MGNTMSTKYLISKNSLREQFFVSSSAYDRARWVKSDDATAYRTVELAESALRKLYKAGQIQARIVPISETTVVSDDGELSDGDSGASDKTRSSTKMVAAKQQDVCPECHHEPCTCHQEEGDEGSDTLYDDNAEDHSDDEDHDRGHGSDDDDDDDDDDHLTSDDLSDDTFGEYDDHDYVKESNNEPLSLFQSQDPDMWTAESKRDLNGAIKQATQAARSDNDANASFALTLLDALMQIKSYLSDGSEEGVHAAAVFMTSLMSPIVNNIPPSVIKFIANYGNTNVNTLSLKSAFDDKWQTKR